MLKEFQNHLYSFTAEKLKGAYPEHQVRKGLSLIGLIMESFIETAENLNLTSDLMKVTKDMENAESRNPSSILLCTDYMYSTLILPSKNSNLDFLRRGKWGLFLANYYINLGMATFCSVLMCTDTILKKDQEKDGYTDLFDDNFALSISMRQNLLRYKALYENDATGKQLAEAIIRDGEKLVLSRKIRGVYLDSAKLGLATAAKIFTAILPVAKELTGY